MGRLINGKITSRYDGVIKKLHYEPDAMAQVGKVNEFCLWSRAMSDVGHRLFVI